MHIFLKFHSGFLRKCINVKFTYTFEHEGPIDNNRTHRNFFNRLTKNVNNR